MRDDERAPLFRFDPGWPFVLAGLLLLAAGILIPGHRELLELRGELVRQETREQMAFEQLRAYDEFLAGVRESDPEVIRRLAMAHLNKIPAGEESLLLTPGMNQTVGEWVESSIPDRTVVVPPYPDTVLARWANGPGRLWLLGAAATLLFAGFVLGPSTAAIPALGGLLARRRPEGAAMAVPITDGPSGGTDPVEAVVDGGMASMVLETSETTEGDVPIVAAMPGFDLIEVRPAQTDSPDFDLRGIPSENDSTPDPSGAHEEFGSSAIASARTEADVIGAECEPDRVDDLRVDELELWRASESIGDWSATEWVDRLPPEESVPSCDDVTRAFLDRCDGAIEPGSVRGAD